jgi:hypothetical protein
MVAPQDRAAGGDWLRRAGRDESLRGRFARRRRAVPDPPDQHLSEDMMETLATSEGMPEVDER